MPICDNTEILLTSGNHINHWMNRFSFFRDRSPVTPSHMRLIFQSCLKSVRLNYKNYRLHGIRAGRALDLLNMGVSVETIKQLGQWKSNAVYAYLRKI